MVGCEALGAYVGALGPLLGPMLAVLGPKLAVWEGDQAGKWPKPEREGPSGEGMEIQFFREPGPRNAFFL